MFDFKDNLHTIQTIGFNAWLRQYRGFDELLDMVNDIEAYTMYMLHDTEQSLYRNTRNDALLREFKAFASAIVLIEHQTIRPLKSEWMCEPGTIAVALYDAEATYMKRFFACAYAEFHRRSFGIRFSTYSLVKQFHEIQK